MFRVCPMVQILKALTQGMKSRAWPKSPEQTRPEGEGGGGGEGEILPIGTGLRKEMKLPQCGHLRGWPHAFTSMTIRTITVWMKPKRGTTISHLHTPTSLSVFTNSKASTSCSHIHHTIARTHLFYRVCIQTTCALHATILIRQRLLQRLGHQRLHQRPCHQRLRLRQRLRRLWHLTLCSKTTTTW